MLVRISMGQAYASALENRILEMGGAVVNSGYADGSTTWTVVAEFPPRTRQRDVAQLLWAKWPSASVTVKKI